ncbi:hypothetical protein JCM13591A_24450 [Microbacterium xylanilyticum]
MPLMEQVRELGAAEAHLEEDTIRTARTALIRKIAQDRRAQDPVRTRRRRWAGIGIGGLVVGAAATAIVVGSVLTPPAAPNASAAEMLNKAADVTINAIDTTLKPGQYLKIEETGESMQYWKTPSDQGTSSRELAFNAWRRDADAAFEVREPRVLYVPADRAGDWYHVIEPQSIGRTFGSQGEKAAQDWVQSHQEPFWVSGEVWTVPAGLPRGKDGAPPEADRTWDHYRPFYAEMPRDPAALLDWLRGRSGMAGKEADAWLVASLEDPASVNLMPPDLRAAFFRAIALIPGFEVESTEGARVTLSYLDTVHDRPESLVIDTEQGYITQFTDSEAGPSVAGDLPDRIKRVATTVVDALPDSVKLRAE